MRYRLLAAASVAFGIRALGAQTGATTARHDSLHLNALLATALQLDPRQRQLSLDARATALRLANIDAERLPMLTLDGQAQYQSDVTSISVPIPNVSIPSPPHDIYDAHLGAHQSIFDPTVAPRRTVARAQLAEAQAQTRTTLVGLRQQVDDAFFAAATIQERATAVDAAILGLSARLRETVALLDQGAALPGDTAAIAATILQREQDRFQLHADRAAAFARLSNLVGRPIGENETLVVDDYADAMRMTLRTLDTLRVRPEYQQFAAARRRLESQNAMESAQQKPTVSAFGRVGYGRPGLDMLSRDFETYWLAGVQVHWAPWTWGKTARDREASQLQEEIVTTNEAAFAQQLRREVQTSIATAARLDSTLVLDARIVALREAIDRETRAKLSEGVVSAAEYVDKNTDVLTARLTQIQHRVALAQARATFLSTLGVEIP